MAESLPPPHGADAPRALPASESAAALLALRQRAEQRRHLVTQPVQGQSPDELQRLVQELQIHQIELEMQNEELLLAQAEVQQARAQYVDLYDFAPVGYVTLSAAGLIEQLNLSAARLLGTSRQRLEGRRLALFVAPADRPAFHGFLTQAQAAEHSLSCELRLLREDGTLFFAQLEALRAAEPAGLPAGAHPASAPAARVRLALLDSTARHEATTELAALAARHAATAEREASAARFRSLFEQSPDGMLLIDNDRFVDGNAAALRLFGLTDKSQLHGQPVDIFSPERQPDGRRSGEKMPEHLAAARHQGWSRFEWYRQDAAGQPQWLEITAAPVVIGPQSLMQMAVRDITAQRAAREQLQASEARQQLALAATESGVWRRDLRTGLFEGDARTWSILGWAGQPEPLPLSETDRGVHPDDLPLLLAGVERALREQTPIEMEHRYYRPDGELLYLQVRGRLEPAGPDGESASFTGLVRDVTARHQTEEELNYKNRLLDRLLHNLPVVLSQITPEGRYLELAGQGLRRLGIADNTCAGAQIEDVFPALAPALYELHAGGPLSFVSRTELRGEPAYYQHYGFFDEQRQRVVVFSIDVTEREHLREESLRQQRAQQHAQQQQVLGATLEAQEAERRRIAESLHNGLGQLLYAAKLTLAGPPDVAVRRALPLLDEAIRATRTISFELTPGVLNDFGLATALQELAKRLPREALRLRLHLHGLGAQRLPPAVEMAAYRIAQELLNNVIKHAQAREANLHVTLLAGPPAELHLLMQDDGRGFDPAEPLPLGGGSGLRSIRHRVELLDGRLRLDSRPGQGTAIAVELPL
ncbi:PAS domain S-box protein [uncultured Hymenobacter sp.]|uniref:PAS domain S-box protein n=1 Tax=uncultured Hymenobacter sp. TaxID=170016 RepID=UPI0035C9BA31